MAILGLMWPLGYRFDMPGTRGLPTSAFQMMRLGMYHLVLAVLTRLSFQPCWIPDSMLHV